MGLVKCQECGHSVAKSAPTCPSCGVDRRQPQEVVVRARGTASTTLGIAAVALGVVSLCGAWVPFLGLLTVPIAGIGAMLAGLGFVLSLFRGLRTAGLPVLGGSLCVAAIALAGSMTAAVGEQIERANRKQLQARAEKKQAAAEESDAYVAQYVDLYDVEARHFQSALDGRIPGVTFKIKNRGDRALNRVKVVVYFEDATGNVIAEENFVPVSTASFMSNSEPLKPGYIWQLEKNKMYTATSVPSEWAEGRVRAQITEVELGEQSLPATPR